MQSYLFFYVIAFASLHFSKFEETIKRKTWDTFTRIMSTVNSLACFWLCLTEIPNLFQIGSLNFTASDESLSYLYSFVSYLLVDGVFDLAYNWKEDFSLFKFADVLTYIHHFLGAYGIYLIASTKLGFFLGLYFCFTEISTPFLNVSWITGNQTIFLLFSLVFFCCRILSAPFLLWYLSSNSLFLASLPPHQYLMSYYASYALMLLNCIWMVFIIRKAQPILHKELSKLVFFH